MAISTHPKNKVAYYFPNGKRKNRGITSDEVKDLALSTIIEHIQIIRPERVLYSIEEIFSVLLHAASNRTTIEQAAETMKDTPHPNTVRLALKQLDIEELEREINEALVSHLPRKLFGKPLEVAVDIKLIPYYGEPKEGEEDFIIKGKARDGTTTFFAYASIYVIKKDKRFTLALKAVRKNEGILAVLKWLLDRFERFGGVVRCLYLDRGFYSVEVLRFLIYEKDIPFVMAAPKRGKKGGINGLIKREGPGVFPYKVRSPFYGEISVTVAIVSRNLKGRWGKHRRETYAYVIHCFPFSFSSLFEKYRHRFGIETSHRVWGQARAWTTSCSASRRFLLLGIAVLFCNLWSFIKWMAISIKRRGGRLVFHSWFTFGRMCSFLSRALERRYGVVEEVIIHV